MNSMIINKMTVKLRQKLVKGDKGSEVSPKDIIIEHKKQEYFPKDERFKLEKFDESEELKDILSRPLRLKVKPKRTPTPSGLINYSKSISSVNNQSMPDQNSKSHGISLSENSSCFQVQEVPILNTGKELTLEDDMPS